MDTSDQYLQTLIEKTLLDEERKQRYLSALPKMGTELKLKMLIQLLRLRAAKMQLELNDRFEAKVMELYEQKKDDFDQGLYADIANQVLTEYSDEIEGSVTTTMSDTDKEESAQKAREIAEKLRQLAEEVKALQ